MATLEKPAASVKNALAPKALVLITEEADISKGIKTAQTTGKSLQARWHLLACSIIAHMEGHKAKGTNADLANALVRSLPEGVRKNALINWFCEYSSVVYDTKAKKLCHDRALTTKQIKAEATPFWLFKAGEGTDYTPFNLAESIASLLKRAASAEANHAGKNMIDSEMLAALKAIVPAAPEKVAA